MGMTEIGLVLKLGELNIYEVIGNSKIYLVLTNN